MSTIPQTLEPGPLGATPPDALSRATSHPIGRWLTPSLSDLLFIAFFVWLFVAGGDGWRGLLLDGDTGWHIRTGEYILDHGSVPRVDLFSFTKPGAQWYAWEWLSDVALALLHRAFGLKGVVFAAGVIIAGWAVLLLRQALWRGAHPWLALAVTLPGIGAASIHFLARPHILTLAFATISVWMIESDLAKPRWRVWLLVPLTVLWANTHGAFVVLILLLGLTAIGAVAEAWGGVRSWGAAVRYSVLTVACGSASILNPYGLRLHEHIAGYLRSDWIRNVVQEFRAPDFRSESQLQFEALLIIGVAVAAILASRKRFVHALWILVFGHLALTSLRHAPVYIAVVAPVLAQAGTELWRSAVLRSGPNSAAAILDRIGLDSAHAYRRTSLWIPLFLAGYLLLASAAVWPQDFPALNFPTRMAQRYSDLISRSRVLTVDQWGDYLIYRFYPRQRVFADGRSDFYGPEIGGEYVRAVEGDYRWRDTLNRYAVEVVLAPPTWALSTILKSDGGWRVVADDGSAVLFVRAARR